MYNQLRSPDGRFESFMEYGAVAMEKDNKWKLLKDIDIVSFKVLFVISRGPCKCVRVTLMNWKVHISIIFKVHICLPNKMKDIACRSLCKRKVAINIEFIKLTHY